MLLLYKGWGSQRSQNGIQTQWRGGTLPQIMLNTDMALGFPIDTTVLPPAPGVPPQACFPAGGIPGGAPQCVNPTNTTAPSTFALARRYANDNGLFQRAFVSSYNRMVSVGYGGVPKPVDGSTRTGKLGTLTTIDLSTC